MQSACPFQEVVKQAFLQLMLVLQEAMLHHVAQGEDDGEVNVVVGPEKDGDVDDVVANAGDGDVLLS